MDYQYLTSKYVDSLKNCLDGVNLCTFTGKGLSQDSYMLFYPFMDNLVIDVYIEECASVIYYWVHKPLKVLQYNDDGIKGVAVSGWRKDWSNRKNGVVDILTYKNKMLNCNEFHIGIGLDLIDESTKIIKMQTDGKVKVILMNIPNLDLLDEYEMVVDCLFRFAFDYENVEYWNFSPRYCALRESFYGAYALEC